MRTTLRALAVRAVAVAAFAAFAIASPALAQTPPPERPAAKPEGKWTFAVQPYLWLAGIDGVLKYDIPSGEGGGADIGLSLEDLDFVFMISAEARTGNWALLTDVIYVDVESSHDTVEAVRFPGPGGHVTVGVDPNSETRTGITAWEWTLAGAYTVARSRRASFEVLGGVRYLTLEAESEWRLDGEITTGGSGRTFARQGSVSESADLWDAVVGVRGELLLGGRWFVPYYGDIGAGSSQLTWQGVTGIAYRFSWWDLRLTYRYLHYDMDHDDLLQGVSFQGGAVSAKFRF
jgi:hypothetical protein